MSTAAEDIHDIESRILQPLEYIRKISYNVLYEIHHMSASGKLCNMCMGLSLQRDLHTDSSHQLHQ